MTRKRSIRSADLRCFDKYVPMGNWRVVLENKQENNIFNRKRQEDELEFYYKEGYY
jgi:hypothetical protein